MMSSTFVGMVTSFPCDSGEMSAETIVSPMSFGGKPLYKWVAIQAGG
jgi:hypothetical protein